MEINGVIIPESIPREKVLAFLLDLGIDPNVLGSFEVLDSGINARVYALNAEGKRYLATIGGEIAIHDIHIRFDDEKGVEPNYARRRKTPTNPKD